MDLPVLFLVNKILSNKRKIFEWRLRERTAVDDESVIVRGEVIDWMKWRMMTTFGLKQKSLQGEGKLGAVLSVLRLV